MQVTKSDREMVGAKEPDAEGSFCEVYFLPEAALKTVSTREELLEENIELTDSFSPETVYDQLDEEYIVKQKKADWIYRPGNRSELENFMEETAHVVEEAESNGVALDFKPTNFGSYDGEPLYFDNSDVVSVRPMEDPQLGMATQLEECLDNQDYYRDTIPSREEIRGYWS